MSPNKTLVGDAVLRGDTSDQIELVLWLIVVGSMGEQSKEGTQISATLDRVTVIQHSGMIEEEDGQNDGRSVAGSDVLWQPLDFVIRVDYKSLRFNTPTGHSQIHVENLEVRGSHGFDGEVAKIVDGEVGVVRMSRVHHIQDESHAVGEGIG